MKNTRRMILVSFFIALQVILTRFLSVETPIVRVSFGFLPLAICAMIFGPMIGGVSGGIADIIGMFIFPKSAYFPGFTLSAILSGFIYGFFLHKKDKNLLNIALASLCVTIFIDLGLNTLWLTILTRKAIYGIFVPRFIKNLIEIPIKIGTIYISWKAIEMYLKKSYTKA